MATKKTSTSKATSAVKPATPGAKAATEVKPKAPAKTAAKKSATKADKGDLGAETSRVTATDTQADSSAKQTPAAPEKRKPTAQDVAVHAYHKWEKRGRTHGAHHDDWHEAEKELHS